ncbi:serine/threonine protein kinase [Actinomycetospora callitridis]|uniref:serine/threonine protein kinase n=1 Tax=Actinomycetospora callitridis TaxID=913944 RepID=UPI002365D516|nr:serine/threonine protein kinase [Actinomycetospora callitridis]MDD7920771.1 protein kinase [Actinomycetospora callitridis]
MLGSSARSPRPRDDRSVPEVVADRYEVGALVGTGSIATVHRGYDRLLQRPVAVKLFPSGTSARTRAPLGREVAAVTQLHHPGLAVLYDAGTEGDRAYLVTQLVDGPSLAARLRRGPLALRAVAPLGAHLSAALAYVHARHVAHGDVRPGNVVLGPEGRPMLTDLGLAELVDLSGLTVGRGALTEERGPAADVHGLGVTLRAALTGPSGDEGPGPVPDELDALLVQMTADDPAARPSAAEVNEALRHGGTTASRPSGWGSPVVPVGPGAADDALLDPALLTGSASAPERAPAAFRRRAGLTVAAGALAVGAVVGGAAGVGEVLHFWGGQADGSTSFASVDTTPMRSGLPEIGAPIAVVPGMPWTPAVTPSPVRTPSPVPTEPGSGAGGLRTADRAGDATGGGDAQRGAPATGESREDASDDRGSDPGDEGGDEGRTVGGDRGEGHDDGHDEARDGGDEGGDPGGQEGDETGGDSGGDSGGRDGGDDGSGDPDDGASSESGSDLGDADPSVI